MNQSSVIVGAVIIGFIIYVFVRGDATVYQAILLGSSNSTSTTAATGTSTSAGTTATVPSSTTTSTPATTSTSTATDNTDLYG